MSRTAAETTKPWSVWTGLRLTLDWELGAVVPAAHQLETDAHRALLWVDEELFGVLGYECLHRLADELFALPAEEAFGPLVSEDDAAIGAGDDQVSGADSIRVRKFDSALLRSVRSRIAVETRTTPSVASGLSLISTGNSVPSRRRPSSSKPSPIGRTSGLSKNRATVLGVARSEPLGNEGLDGLADERVALPQYVERSALPG